ncbi:MAG: MarR family transcriptional regulator, partial [Raoultibacter sp.]
MPVVLLNSEIDPRQCRALVDKRIPFVIPNKQVYLPFLAFAATAKATKKDYDGSLSARAQAALVTLIANPAISTAKELGEVSKLLPSDVTRAIDELAQRNLIERSKAGRAVTITWDVSKNALLHTAMPLLSSPVARTFYVKTTGTIAHLPDAGDSALAQRSMLGFPPIAQKAIDRKALKNLEYVEVLEGEVDNADTCEIQVWNYNPLVAGLGAVDDVSLALSLVGEEDERVLDQLNKLFGSDDIWQ